MLWDSEDLAIVGRAAIGLAAAFRRTSPAWRPPNTASCCSAPAAISPRVMASPARCRPTPSPAGHRRGNWSWAWGARRNLCATPRDDLPLMYEVELAHWVSRVESRFRTLASVQTAVDLALDRFRALVSGGRPESLRAADRVCRDRPVARGLHALGRELMVSGGPRPRRARNVPA